MAQTEINSAAADSFDDFLQAAIKDYADRGWQRPNFVALLIASGQSASLAKNALSTGDGLKTVALGTVGVMALPASLLAGVLWSRVSPSAPFAFGAVLAVLALIALYAIIDPSALRVASSGLP